MTRNGSNVVLKPEEYDAIYKCWNGKGKSCIRTRNISEEKKNCALGKIIDSLDTEALIKAIKDPEEKEQEFTPQEEYEYRKEIVEYISHEYGYDAHFETLLFTKKNSGDRVKINKKSRYADQNDGEGTILEESSDRGWFNVCFDDGYQNSYPLDDLIIIKKKIEDGDEQIRIHNDAVLQNIKEESRNEFLDNLALILFDTIQKDKNILIKMFPNNDFQPGDKIVMNKDATTKYNYTKEGSTGVVVNVGKQESNIHFNTIKSSDYSGEKHPTWEIENKYMINLSRSQNKEITLNDVVKLLGKILHSLENKKKEKMVDKRKLVTQLLLKENFLLPGDDKENYVLNYREMTRFVAPKLYSTYGNKDIYNEIDMCAPPSESHPNVLQFAFSTGCDYNRCTYCDLYKRVKYCPKTFEQIKEHIDTVLESVKDHREEIERVFIGSGNALALNDKILVNSLNYINEVLNPSRIAMYARTQDINKKGVDILHKLNNAGLTNLYRGAETGSDEILQYVKKGTTLNEMLEASKTLAKTNIDLSVTLMPGIGGIRFDKENREGTIKFLNATDTHYITFMAITPSPNSEYDLTMKEEMMANTNRPLSNVEIVKQIKAILKGLEPKGQKIGMYGPEIHGINYNPFYFKVTFDKKGKKEANKLCKEYLRTHIV